MFFFFLSVSTVFAFFLSFLLAFHFLIGIMNKFSPQEERKGAPGLGVNECNYFYKLNFLTEAVVSLLFSVEFFMLS